MVTSNPNKGVEMGNGDTTAPGRFVWHDLMTTNLEASKSFYNRLFGWTFSQQDLGPLGSYNVIRLRGRGIGGMVPMDASHGLTTHWISYLTVADVDALCQRMVELGGSVAVGPRGVRRVGHFAILKDPAESVFSAIHLAGDPPSPDEPAEPGSFCWNQLLTRDPAVSARFYAEVCGWTLETRGSKHGAPRGVFKRGAEDAAGLLPMSADIKGEPEWLLYVAVDDVDAAAAEIKALGGDVVAGTERISGVGNCLVAADPIGAKFGLVVPEKGDVSRIDVSGTP